MIQQALVEKLPETVRAAVEAYRGIDHLVVLNGAEGMSGITSQVLGAGLATLPLLQDLLTGRNGIVRGRGEEERPAASEPAPRFRGLASVVVRGTLAAFAAGRGHLRRGK